jgi:hypothetical protein
VSQFMCALAAQVCSLLGVPVPVLDPDEHGLLAFTLTVHDLPISIVQDADDGQGDVQLLVFCGEVPASQEARVLRELLQMNLLLLSPQSSRFCLNPMTGHIVLARALRPERIDARGVLDEARALTRAVRAWRERLLCPTGPSADADGPQWV